MNRIKDVLKERGLTQKELAEMMNVSAALVSRIIDGNPTLETLHKIASVLNVSVSSLIEESIDFINCPNCGVKLRLIKN